MSIAVELADVAATARAHGDVAYLLTSSPRGPRVVACRVRWPADAAAEVTVRPGSAERMRASPAVALLWPPAPGERHSLIVDGTAHVGEEGVVTIAVTGAVLHVGPQA